MRNVHPHTAKTKRRTVLFFEIGMILALSLVLWAFNYSSIRSVPDLEIYSNEDEDNIVNQIGEIFIEPDELLASRTETQKQSDRYRIVPDPTPIPDPGPSPEPLPSIPSLPPIEPNVGPEIDPGTDNSPLLWASQMPEFPGGVDMMRVFINKELRYPELAIENGIQGRVVVSFIVEKDGSLTNIEVLNSVGWGIDDEAIRVIKSMPKWTPGENNYRAVRVRVSLPIKFVFK